MEAIERTRSQSIAIPKQKGARPRPMPEPRFEYNAGLDTFQPHSPPEQMALGKSLVRRFAYGLADWIDPAGAKPNI